MTARTAPATLPFPTPAARPRPRRHAVGPRFTAAQALVERGLNAKAKRVRRALAAAGRNAEGTQATVLRDLVRRARRSDFGRDRGLPSIRRREDVVVAVRARVPVGDYESHRPYIDAALAGRPRALFSPGERVRMFALTSGTTAARKYLPVTGRGVRAHRRGWLVWGLGAYEHEPELLFRGKFALAGDPAESVSPGGTACGSISGLLADEQTGVVRRSYVAPPRTGRLRRTPGPLGAAADPAAAKYYLNWRFGLHSDVGSFVTPNPATHLGFARWGAANAELLIDHALRGGLPDDAFRPGGPLAGLELPREVRRAAAKHLPADPGLAAELKSLVRASGALRPADVWPHLNLLGCWTGGTLGHYLPLLKDHYGDARVRDIGLIASEGRTTIPVEDGAAAGLLDLAGAFFEFVPEGEIDDDEPQTLLAHELEPGRNYFVLMTTPGGLWRYDIRDVVRCEGYAPPAGSPRELGKARGRGTPLLSFLSKGKTFSSVAGEKLSEHQVAAAVGAACAACGARLSAYALAPVFNGGSPRYELFAAAAELPANPAPLAAAVDERLRAGNCEYDSKRGTGRLGRAGVRPLPAGAWAAWDAARLARTGGVAEQYKRPVLVADLNFAAEIDPGVRRAAG